MAQQTMPQQFKLQLRLLKLTFQVFFFPQEIITAGQRG